MTAQPQILNLRQPLREVRLTIPGNSAANAHSAEAQAGQAIYEQGRADGEKKLSEQLLQQRQDILQLQHGVLKSLQEAVPQVVRDCEQALTALAFELAQKLTANAPISAEMVQAAVQEALSHVQETTDYHLYLHPEDLELLQRTNSPLLSSNSGGQHFHFHPAPEITRGGCLVKTQFGIIDAQRETKVELLKKSILP